MTKGLLSTIFTIIFLANLILVCWGEHKHLEKKSTIGLIMIVAGIIFTIIFGLLIIFNPWAIPPEDVVEIIEKSVIKF